MTPDRPEHLFALAYYAWCQDTVPDSSSADANDLNCYQPRGNSSDELKYYCAGSEI